jgi:hypothetical protein
MDHCLAGLGALCWQAFSHICFALGRSVGWALVLRFCALISFMLILHLTARTPCQQHAFLHTCPASACDACLCLPIHMPTCLLAVDMLQMAPSSSSSSQPWSSQERSSQKQYNITQRCVSASSSAFNLKMQTCPSVACLHVGVHDCLHCALAAAALCCPECFIYQLFICLWPPHWILMRWNHIGSIDASLPCYAVQSWLPARAHVKEALDQRKQVHPSGDFAACAWRLR